MGDITTFPQRHEEVNALKRSHFQLISIPDILGTSDATLAKDRGTG
jgi:hypothetical protein